MSNPMEDYRSSHAVSGYGRHYNQTYERGYYAELWRSVERPLLEQVFTQLCAAGARSCLDFACGTGRITCVAERYFEHCVGVDVSQDMLDVARDRCTRSQLLLQDLTRTPLAASFDVVTAFRFFLNAEPGLRADALAALRGSLQPGGCLLLNVHVNAASLLGRAYRLRNRIRRRVVANTMGLDEVRSAVDVAGLTIGHVLWYGCYPRTGWRFQRTTERLLAPAEMYYQSKTWIPRHWAQCFIAVCTRSGEHAAALVDPRPRRSPDGGLIWEC
jgi:SAM-dependent methyltransferase